jgi:hypothetical protein
MKNEMINTRQAPEDFLTSTGSAFSETECSKSQEYAGCSVNLVRGIYHWIYRWKKARRCFIPIGYYTTRGGTRGTSPNKNRKPQFNWVKAIWFVSGNAYRPSTLLERRYPGKSTSMWIIARGKAISDKILPGYFKTNDQGFLLLLCFEGKSTMVFVCQTPLEGCSLESTGVYKRKQHLGKRMYIFPGLGTS